MPMQSRDADSDVDSVLAGDYSSDDDRAETRQNAAGMLLEELTLLYMGGNISARIFCTLCHFASLAALNAFNKYGQKPGQQTGKYQRHLDRIFKFKKDDGTIYKLGLPTMQRGQAVRSVHAMQCVPVHEALESTMVDDMPRRLAYAKAHSGLPRSYYDDPIVERYPGTDVYPFALYIDGVPYSNTDSVVGVWCANTLSNQRSLVATVRKRILCRCGCKGWCTYYALFDWIAWGMEAASNGRYPNARHDGTRFDNQWDRDRSGKAGKTMGHRFCAD